MRKAFRFLTAGLLICALSQSALPIAMAAERQEETQAAMYLREQEIMVGDANGDLRLEYRLNRLELAVLLSRLHGGKETDPNIYAWACYFTDVPQWARPYVGYCTATLLVAGYGNHLYGSYDPVTPAAACSVVLRACGYGGEGSLWSYNTACSYAVSLGLIDQDTAQTAAITRGNMALLIYRALLAQGAVEAAPIPPQEEEAPPPPVMEDIPGPSEYTIDIEHWSREDFSTRANPAVFTGVYDRALYNAIQRTLVDTGGQSDSGYRYAYTMVDDGAYSAVKNLLGRMDGILRYEHHVPQNLANYYEYLDYFAVSAETPENYREALSYIRPIIEEAGRLGTDAEKVTLLNGYLKTLLSYDSRATAGITQTFAPHSGELKAACGSYARAFKFLCSAADIPCISISTDVHTWNVVYADGQWLHVDVSSNDQMVRDSILLLKSLPSRTDRVPEATAFLKELLVPGSSK